MKTPIIQSYSPIRFSGLIKNSKIVPVNIMDNPTEEVLKEAEARWQKQIEDLGLVVIKDFKLFMRQKSKPPVKSIVKGVKKENV